MVNSGVYTPFCTCSAGASGFDANLQPRRQSALPLPVPKTCCPQNVGLQPKGIGALPTR